MNDDNHVNSLNWYILSYLYLMSSLVLLIICYLSVRSNAIDFPNAEIEARKIANLIHQRFEFQNASTRQFFLGASNIKRFYYELLS